MSKKSNYKGIEIEMISPESLVSATFKAAVNGQRIMNFYVTADGDYIASSAVSSTQTTGKIGTPVSLKDTKSAIKTVEQAIYDFAIKDIENMISVGQMLLSGIEKPEPTKADPVQEALNAPDGFDDSGKLLSTQGSDSFFRAPKHKQPYKGKGR